MERRHLSVVFCDLVGSSALSAQLDPEVMHGVLCAYHRTCAEIIRRFDGYIAQYLGDGLLVYFSFPTAHEDDAVRAVQASLDLLQAVANLATPLRSEFPALEVRPLQARIGIHTGEVVVGQVGHAGRQETIAVGEIPNIAARLQALAEPQSVLISAATYELIEGFFDCRSQGATTLKGFPEPITNYRVVGPSGQQSRFAVAKAAGLRPLIGRTEILERLRDAWAETRQGRGQAILLRGEPGIGKSRLVQALKDSLREDPLPWRECQASTFLQHSAFQPVIDLLRIELNIHPADPPEHAFVQLQAHFHQHHDLHPTWVALFGVLLSVIKTDALEAQSIAGFSARKLRSLTIEALIGWLSARVHQRPLVIICEDMQWVDPSTLDFIAQLLSAIPGMPLFLLMTARPEFIPPADSESALRSLTITGLFPDQLVALVQGVTGKSLPAPLLKELLAKADGNPLYAEELAKMLLIRGRLAGPQDPQTLAHPSILEKVPARLQDLLAARLDSVGEAKRVAQLGAVIGRTFPRPMLTALADMDGAELDISLRHLQDAELIQPLDLRNRVYQFKHALIQEAAYASLLVSVRRNHHCKIVSLLEGNSDPVPPEILAFHCERGEIFEKAIDYWRMAGERAVERYANLEAVSHLQRALALINRLESTPVRHCAELSIWLSAISALGVTHGGGSPPVREALERAQELLRYESEVAVRRKVLVALATFNVIGGRCDVAKQLAQDLLPLSDQTDPEQQRQNHYLLGVSALYSGALTDGINALKTSTRIPLGSLRPVVSSHVRSLDPRPGAYAFLGVAYWIRGFPDQASRATAESCRIATELQDPYAISGTNAIAGLLHALRGDYDECLRVARISLEYALKRGFGLYLGLSRMATSWAMIKLGNVEDGRLGLTEGLHAYRATGAKAMAPFAFCIYVDLLRDRLPLEESFAAIDEAYTLAEASHDYLMLAEVYRVRGELLASKANNPVDAERCFQKAAKIARGQKAISLILRVAIRRGKWLAKQGRLEEATGELGDALLQFTEGFGTCDLIEANDLLDQWSGRTPAQVKAEGSHGRARSLKTY